MIEQNKTYRRNIIKPSSDPHSIVASFRYKTDRVRHQMVALTPTEVL